MKPLVALVGRTNVGKSTLFNRILGKNKAVIDDLPGLTRDRNYALARWDEKEFILVDTGGFDPVSQENLYPLIREQTQYAIDEADFIILLLDGREGLNPADVELVRIVQAKGKPIVYVINKVEGPAQREKIVDFYQLGVDTFFPISAKHKIGIYELMSEVVSHLPSTTFSENKDGDVIKIAIVGRPNVGKSSLLNKLIGNKRFLTHPSPGTTRDAIDTHFIFNGQDYLLIDTAGIRRKSKVSLSFEKYCIIEALRSIDRCDIAILVIDAQEGVTQQDGRIAHFVYQKGKACIIAVNKWDLIIKDKSTYKKYFELIRKELKFLEFAPVIFTSALTGQHVSSIFKNAPLVYTHYQRRIPTPLLNQALQQAVHYQPPPLYKNKPLKFYYATQIAQGPPHVVIFTNHPYAVNASYQRFLINQIRKTFGFEGTPIRLTFKRRRRKKKEGINLD